MKILSVNILAKKPPGNLFLSFIFKWLFHTINTNYHHYGYRILGNEFIKNKRLSLEQKKTEQTKEQWKRTNWH
jgi:hypothetical protein